MLEYDNDEITKENLFTPELEIWQSARTRPDKTIPIVNVLMWSEIRVGYVRNNVQLHKKQDGLTPRTLLLCIICLLPGMDIDINAPQFTQVSFKYFPLDHPVRRLCIRILLSPWVLRLETLPWSVPHISLQVVRESHHDGHPDQLRHAGDVPAVWGHLHLRPEVQDAKSRKIVWSVSLTECDFPDNWWRHLRLFCCWNAD